LTVRRSLRQGSSLHACPVVTLWFLVAALAIIAPAPVVTTVLALAAAGVAAAAALANIAPLIICVPVHCAVRSPSRAHVNVCVDGG